MINLLQNVKVSRIEPDATAVGTYELAAGITDVNTAIVDVTGGGQESCRFIVVLGAMAAGSTVDVKAQQGNASDMSDAADLAGTASTQATATDDDKIIIVDVARPSKRYLRLVITRGNGGNSEIKAVIAYLYDDVNGASTQGATVLSAKAVDAASEAA